MASSSSETCRIPQQQVQQGPRLRFFLLLFLLLLLLHTLQSIVSNKTLSPLLLNFSPSSAHLVDLDRTVDVDHKLFIPEGKKHQKL